MLALKSFKKLIWKSEKSHLKDMSGPNGRLNKSRNSITSRLSSKSPDL